MFNLSFHDGIFPDKLKESRIVPIFKNGNHKLCDNYRPISLVNTLSKVLEKIVANKLTNHLQLNNLLYKHQYGFMRGLSTEHNLMHVTNFISSALNDSEYCIGIFLDLRKAFDVCSHDILLKKLNRLGVEGKEYSWFKTYLANRKQKVDINGILSDESIINISVLQGTTLGPILFLCYINDIYTATTLATYLFADDTTCLAKNKNLNALIDYVNIELRKLSNWFDSNKMAINVSKTKYIIFRTKGKKIDNPQKVVINTNEINVPENPDLIYELERVYLSHPNSENRSFKLLGVYFDEYLNFDNHISHLCAKLSRANYCINRAKSKLSPKSLKCLYYALFHPHLLYCINVYTCTSLANVNRIAKLQKKVIRNICKTNYNTHTDILFKNSEILPFQKLITMSRLNFMHSVCYNYAPKTFLECFPKNEANPNYNLRTRSMYKMPNVRIEFFKKFPYYTFPLAWNEAGDVTFQNNKITFQISLKNLLLNNLFDDQRLYFIPE